MSPVFASPSALMSPTTLFPMHAGFTPAMMTPVFPPSIEMLQGGIDQYRHANGYDTHESYPHHIVGRLLEGEEFTANGKKLRIDKVTIHPVANQIYKVGNVEMNARLLLGPIAAAVAAYPYVGKGGKENAKEIKDYADGVATEAMRTAFGRRSIKGEIRGGEGGGRDSMERDGALYLRESVGTGYGIPVEFLVDPLEVTNATKALDPNGSYGDVGHGWSPEKRDPTKWFPGYSGASSLMLAIDGRQGGSRALSDFLYLDKLQIPHRTARYMAANGINLTSSPGEIVKAISNSLEVEPSKIRAAALARSRHLSSMNGWMEAGIMPHNIMTPSDGDALFSPALAAGALHFAGLTGGVMEGTISAAIGIPMGIRTYMQFVSHDSLGEHKENANLLDTEHRFGFSDREYNQMELTRLFDAEHIGHTLRNIRPDGEMASDIKNSAHSAYTQGLMGETDYRALGERLRKIADGNKDGERFNAGERSFLRGVFENKGYLDVRKVLRFSDLVQSRDWLVGVSAITPNRWAPLEGMREKNFRLVVDTLVVGGSNAVYILETEIEET